jgi:hypothetical protein
MAVSHAAIREVAEAFNRGELEFRLTHEPETVGPPWWLEIKAREEGRAQIYLETPTIAASVEPGHGDY